MLNTFNIILSTIQVLPVVNNNGDVLGNLPVMSTLTVLIVFSLFLTFNEQSEAIHRVLGLLLVSIFAVFLWMFQTYFLFIYLVYILAFIGAVLMLFLSVVLMLPISMIRRQYQPKKVTNLYLFGFFIDFSIWSVLFFLLTIAFLNVVEKHYTVLLLNTQVTGFKRLLLSIFLLVVHLIGITYVFTTVALFNSNIKPWSVTTLCELMSRWFNLNISLTDQSAIAAYYQYSEVRFYGYTKIILNDSLGFKSIVKVFSVGLYSIVVSLFDKDSIIIKSTVLNIKQGFVLITKWVYCTYTYLSNFIKSTFSVLNETFIQLFLFMNIFLTLIPYTLTNQLSSQIKLVSNDINIFEDSNLAAIKFILYEDLNSLLIISTVVLLVALIGAAIMTRTKIRVQLPILSTTKFAKDHTLPALRLCNMGYNSN